MAWTLIALILLMDGENPSVRRITIADIPTQSACEHLASGIHRMVSDDHEDMTPRPRRNQVAATNCVEFDRFSHRTGVEQ